MRHARILTFVCGLSILLQVIGCSGSTEIIIPKDELTAEQIEKVKAEDQAVEDEESQGSNKNRK